MRIQAESGAGTLAPLVSELPGVPLTAQLLDRFTPIGLIMASRVGRRCIDLIDHCSSQTLLEGVNLLVLEKDSSLGSHNGVLKVIHDRRTTLEREPLVSGELLDEEAFLARANLMVNERVYSGRSAAILGRVDESGPLTHLVRSVAYYQAAPSGKQLSGVHSTQIASSRLHPIMLTALLPPLKIGTVYTEADNITSEVVAAEILRPTGRQGVRAAPLKNRFAFSPLPMPA